MNYEDLTERIKKAEVGAKSRLQVVSQWWNGYLVALNDIRNDINTGGEKQCKKKH